MLRVWVEFKAVDIETVKAIVGRLYDVAKKGDIVGTIKVCFAPEEE